MNDNNKIITPKEILELANAYKKSKLLLTAVELKVFDHFDGGLKDAGEAASRLNLDKDKLERLLNALVSLGFMHKVKAKYFNMEETSKYLVSSSPDYLSGLSHTASGWEAWSNLSSVLEEGFNEGRSIASLSLTDLRLFIEAMDARGKKQSDLVALLIDLKNCSSMLDVGGGSGVFTKAFLKKNPQLQSVIFDLSEVIELSKEYFDDDKNKERVKFIGGDYNNINLNEKFDFIFLSAIVHINSFEENKSMISELVKLLSDGGRIAIMDYVLEEDKTSPMNAVLFSLHMMVSTKRGRTYTEKEISSWLIDTGITSIERKEMSFGNSIIIGTKQNDEQ